MRRFKGNNVWKVNDSSCHFQAFTDRDAGASCIKESVMRRFKGKNVWKVNDSSSFFQAFTGFDSDCVFFDVFCGPYHGPGPDPDPGRDRGVRAPALGCDSCVSFCSSCVGFSPLPYDTCNYFGICM